MKWDMVTIIDITLEWTSQNKKNNPNYYMQVKYSEELNMEYRKDKVITFG